QSLPFFGPHPRFGLRVPAAPTRYSHLHAQSPNAWTLTPVRPPIAPQALRPTNDPPFWDDPHPLTSDAFFKSLDLSLSPWRPSRRARRGEDPAEHCWTRPHGGRLGRTSKPSG